MKKSFVVVEPHADDAFISLGHTIEQWTKRGQDVHIVTLYPETLKREKEAAEYAASVGAKQSCWNYLKDGLPPGELYIPLGIQHKEHIVTNKKFDCVGVNYYVDMPYALKQKNQAEVYAKMNGTMITGFVHPPAIKWRRASIFKSQAKFFHFNKDELIQAFEMVVR